jgi:hypothetical protein
MDGLESLHQGAGLHSYLWCKECPYCGANDSRFFQVIRNEFESPPCPDCGAVSAEC